MVFKKSNINLITEEEKLKASSAHAYSYGDLRLNQHRLVRPYSRLKMNRPITNLATLLKWPFDSPLALAFVSESTSQQSEDARP